MGVKLFSVNFNIFIDWKRKYRFILLFVIILQKKNYCWSYQWNALDIGSNDPLYLRLRLHNLQDSLQALQQALHLVHELHIGVVLGGRLGVWLGGGVVAIVGRMPGPRRSPLILALHSQRGWHKAGDIRTQIPGKQDKVST